MSATPDIRSSSVSTTGYADGLGHRALRFNREVGGMLECLHLRPQFLAFEATLRARARELASLDDERFARVREIEREGNALTVISELVAGHRLIDILETREADDATVSGIDAAFGFLLQAMPALAELHARSITHGAVGPGRILVTPTSQVVLLDSIYGGALERLRLTARTLWTSFGVLATPVAEPAPIDAATDVAQVALCGLLLAAGRPPDTTASTSALAPLIREVAELAEIRAGTAFAEALGRFFRATLPADRMRPLVAAEEASAEIRRLVEQISEDECLNALAELVCFQPVAKAVSVATPLPAGARPTEVIETPSLTTRSTEVDRPIDGPIGLPCDSPTDDPVEPSHLPTGRSADFPIYQSTGQPDGPAADLPVDASPARLVRADIADRAEELFAENIPQVQSSAPPAVTSWPVPAAAVLASPPIEPSVIPPVPEVVAAGAGPAPAQGASASLAPPTAPQPATSPAIVPVWPAPPMPFQAAPMLSTPPAAGPVQVVPAAAPTVVRIRQKAPEGYAPTRARHPEITATPAPTQAAASAGRGNAGGHGITFPWKAATAAVLVISAGFGAFLQGRPDSLRAAPASVSAPREAAPPTPKVTSTGSLVVNSQPAGATVILNNDVAGVTPLIVDAIAAGKHRVEITDGKITVQRTVVIEAGEAETLSVPIFSGWLAVFAPIRLNISEGGRTLGTTDSGRIVLSPGRHVLTLSNTDLGFITSLAVDIQPAEERVLNLKPMGVVNLNASPWAEVWVDGTRAGETPLANLKVPLGTREFIFKHPEYGERKLTATITTSASALSVDFGQRPPSRP